MPFFSISKVYIEIGGVNYGKEQLLFFNLHLALIRHIDKGN